MKIVITYCTAWNYRPAADRVSDEVLKLGDDHQVSFVAGSGGVFEVNVDGRIIFSKADINRFPEPGEIAGLITGE